MSGYTSFCVLLLLYVHNILSRIDPSIRDWGAGRLGWDLGRLKREYGGHGYGSTR